MGSSLRFANSEICTFFGLAIAKTVVQRWGYDDREGEACWTDDAGAVEQASDWLCYTAHYLVIVAYMMVARSKLWEVSSSQPYSQAPSPDLVTIASANSNKAFLLHKGQVTNCRNRDIWIVLRDDFQDGGTRYVSLTCGENRWWCCQRCLSRAGCSNLLCKMGEIFQIAVYCGEMFSWVGCVRRTSPCISLHENVSHSLTSFQTFYLHPTLLSYMIIVKHAIHTKSTMDCGYRRCSYAAFPIPTTPNASTKHHTDFRPYFPCRSWNRQTYTNNGNS